jgi:hypothetical protein
MATGLFPTATETNTTLASVIPGLFAEKMNNFYRDSLKCAAFFTDLSADLASGTKTLLIPNITEMTAHAKSNTAVVTLKCWGQSLTIRLKQSIITTLNNVKELCKLNVLVVGLR